MRRLIILALLIFTSIPIASANQLVVLSAPSYRTATGDFINDELAVRLSAQGDLGARLFQAISKADDVAIDIAFIEEIQDLSDGYSYINSAGEKVAVAELPSATIWLETLRRSLANKNVLSLPYGNPDSAFLKKIAPTEYRFYQAIAATRLSGFIGETLKSVDSVHPTNRSSGELARVLHKSNRSELKRLYGAVAAPEVLDLRLQLAKILNPEISSEALPLLAKDLRAALLANSNKLRVAVGNYTITAAKYDLPITVINDYSLPVSINLKAQPDNTRVIIGNLKVITIPASSQLQIKLPVEVLASGETNLKIKILSTAGKEIGKAGVIPLRLAVISPVTTWFTTGMAVILLIAAVMQSIRRVKRRKK